jgi:hypothetical protein
MRKAEYKYINDRIEEGLNNNDSKPFWRYIKARKRDNIGVSPLKEKDTLTSDSLQKANILLQQFQSVFTKEQVNETLPDVKSKIIQHPLKNIIIDTNGVTKLLENLNTSKANGSDAIPNSILKGCAEQLSPGLSAVFQLSLDSGSLHIDWLKANISSVYKKGDKHLSENYRPISLTCISCKILEHIICRHLMKHLEDNNILTTLNHGFRSGYSCESQLIVTMEDLLQAYDKNAQVNCAIIDFSKAFDTVPHKKLLHKLTEYGINGTIHAWLTQFLTARTMQVVLEGQTTNQVTVDSGVPKGTVLGPLIFFCHINDLPDCVKSQTPLRMIVCSTVKLKPNKITFSIRGKSKHYYSLDNTTLQQVPSNVYLGITIAEDLKWNSHINNITKKANTTLCFLRRNLRSCLPSSRRSAYVSLIRPALEYGTVVWNPCQRTDINTIERVQHRAARFITGDYRSREPGCITSMLIYLNLPPLEDRRRNIRLAYFYKVVQGVIPAIPPQK